MSQTNRTEIHHPSFVIITIISDRIHGATALLLSLKGYNTQLKRPNIHNNKGEGEGCISNAGSETLASFS
jgi:hypothetical protein